VARWICVEQTVEVPEALIDERLRHEVVGRVEAVEGPLVRVSYDASVAAGQLPQLVALLAGNISLREGVRLLDVALPEGALPGVRGPSFGIEGLRERLGARGRPLLGGVLKPRGQPAERLARLAGDFALGGGDLVKDDNNLVDPTRAGFEDRVRRCAAAVAEANAKTGRECLYLANLLAPLEELEPRVESALRLGAAGVLVAPVLLGLDVVRSLSERHRMVVMAHPAFAGSLVQRGLAHGVLFGTLFRLAGVDVSIFVNHHGRFDWSREACLDVAGKCRAPLGGVAPCWAAPAGGMTLDRMAEMRREYGCDTVLVVGGDLLARGDVRAATERFRAAL
jgi:ribulose-bisphosphate carboxylase large chain